jgi:hypothetical protein
MKYLEKSFSSGVNSKLYRENWECIFGDKKKQKFVDIEIDMSADTETAIIHYAERYNITFNDAVVKLLKSQMEIWEGERETNKQITKKITI